jgi:RNA polymerase sigma-70 factor, ECF subfamily
MSPPRPPEPDLLERARAGDARAMEAVLEAHELEVYRFSLRMCGTEHDAQDVLQETLLTAFRQLASFRGEGELSTWLYQIARSFCVKQRRRRGRRGGEHVSLEAPEVAKLATAAPASDTQAHARELAELLRAAMESLPLDQREALVLRDVEDLSAEQAAEVVGIGVAALKSRLHRGRLALRAQLSAVLEAGEGAARLPCQELARELSAYVSSDIDQAACTAVEAHLNTCPLCGATGDALKRTVSLCRSIPGGEVPAAVKAAIRQVMRGAGREPGAGPQ